MWEAATESFAEKARELYEDNLTRLPPPTLKLIRSVADSDPNTAALLAARFARGRSTPDLVVRTLLENEPAWLSAAGAGEGLTAVAEYAHAHGLVEAAVEALLVAADRDPSEAFRRYRAAGLLLMDDDRERASRLLTTARSSPGGADDLHIAIGMAVALHPEGDAAPVSLEPRLKARVEAVKNDEFVLSFRAMNAVRSGDLDAAVTLFEAALVVDPDSVGLMIELAQTLARRARTADARPRDRNASISLASEGMDQLHEWGGPTDFALTTLLQAQMSAGQLAGALDRSLASPDGRATADEARRPGVQATAAVAAHALGRPDLSAKIIESMPDGLDRDLAQARVRSHADADVQRVAWLALVDRLDETRPEALLMAVMRLGELGVDRSERIDGLVVKHIVPPAMKALASASASAAHELDEALPRLRLLAETDQPSALQLITALVRADRYDDAEVAAKAAFMRFRAVEFALLRVDALAKLGRSSEVEALLADVVADSTLDPVNRQLANSRLAAEVGRQAAEVHEPLRTQLWQRVERLMRDCVYAGELPVRDQDVWALAEARLRLGRSLDALATVTENDPAITTNGQARFWLTLVQQGTLTVNWCRRMLDLADQFAEDAELSAGLLTAVITRTRDAEDEPASPADQRLVLDGDLRAAAFSMLQKHIDVHGDETPIKVVTADTPDALIAEIANMMRRDNEPLIEAVEMVRQLRLPIGFLALLARRTYSSMLAERPLGYLITSAALAADDEADEAAASSADGEDVVVDISTLLVATELAEYDNFRGKFRTLLMPGASQADIVRGRLDLDGRASSAGFVTYDSAADSLVASELDVGNLLATLQRFGQLEQATTSVILVPDVQLDALEEIADDDSASWLAPIALAKARGVALWSDDVAQRRLARVFDVPAFGTTTLQQLRTIARLDNDTCGPDELSQVLKMRRDEVVRLLERRIVDVPTDVATVLQAAEKEGWNEGVALITIGRPGWWHMSPNPFVDLQELLQSSGAAGDSWRYHAMWGAVRLATGEPSRQAILLASVAMLPVADVADVEAVLRHLTVAEQVAADRGAHSPSDYLYEAEAMLVNVAALPASTGVVQKLRARLDAQPNSGE